MGIQTIGAIRQPAVAGTFYPADPERLRALVVGQLSEAATRHPPPAVGGPPLGLLVPHAGLEYSGVAAAAGWRLLGARDELKPVPDAPTVVFLGTNHRAGWLTGIGAWNEGGWRTPLDDSAVDEELAAAVLALGTPFTVDLDAHRAEHSIEVQLPFLQVALPRARILPLAVATGTGRVALDAGMQLGEVLAAHRRAGRPIVLAISTDMAHYPSQYVAAWITDQLAPAICALDAVAVAALEAMLRGRELPGVACGMCGIEPTVVGLAALQAMGADHGVEIATATSADAGGSAEQTVGYLTVAFGSSAT